MINSFLKEVTYVVPLLLSDIFVFNYSLQILHAKDQTFAVSVTRASIKAYLSQFEYPISFLCRYFNNTLEKK